MQHFLGSTWIDAESFPGKKGACMRVLQTTSVTQRNLVLQKANESNKMALDV